MRDDDVARVMDRFAVQTAALGDLVANLGDEALDRPSRQHESSIRRWVHHLADTALVGAVRVRAVAACDGATLPAVDFAAWEQRLGYDARAIATSVAAYRAARESTLSLLRALPSSVWTYRGHHEKLGPLTLLALVTQQCDDTDEHLGDIRGELRRD